VHLVLIVVLVILVLLLLTHDLLSGGGERALVLLACPSASLAASRALASSSCAATQTDGEREGVSVVHHEQRVGSEDIGSEDMSVRLRGSIKTGVGARLTGFDRGSS